MNLFINRMEEGKFRILKELNRGSILLGCPCCFFLTTPHAEYVLALFEKVNLDLILDMAQRFNGFKS